MRYIFQDLIWGLDKKKFSLFYIFNYNTRACTSSSLSIPFTPLVQSSKGTLSLVLYFSDIVIVTNTPFYLIKWMVYYWKISRSGYQLHLTTIIIFSLNPSSLIFNCPPCYLCNIRNISNMIIKQIGLVSWTMIIRVQHFIFHLTIYSYL